MKQKQKICYSRKVVWRLMEQGQFPIKELPHPTIKGFKCWAFEWTDEFEEAFLHVTKEVGRNGRS